MQDPSKKPIPRPDRLHEYFNGVRDDGGKLNIISKEMPPPFDETYVKPPIGPHAEGKWKEKPKSRYHLEADQKILGADQAHVQRVRSAVKLLQATVDFGHQALEDLKLDAELARLSKHIELEQKRLYLADLQAQPDPDPQTQQPGLAAPSADQNTPDRPAGNGPHTPADAANAAEPDDKPARKPRGPTGPRGPNSRYSPIAMLTLALRAAPDLVDMSAKLRDLEARLLPAEAELALKQSFYLDRAISVVTDTLNSMDEAFGELGFGNWMPFRYLDQWLMLCGILNRVLAAHGLVPAGSPEIYRKLLEETPPIFKFTADACNPPDSWGKFYRARAYKDFATMIDRIHDIRHQKGPPP